MNSRDAEMLERIVTYASEIEEAQHRFGRSMDVFLNDHVYQNACCMCILQIGEAANKLSEEAKAAVPDIPWHSVRGMRNVLAHDYGTVDPVSLWQTIEQDIPTLKQRCLTALHTPS